MPRASGKGKGQQPDGRHTSIIKVACRICGNMYNAKGLAAHLRKHAKDERDEETYARKRLANTPLAKTPKQGRFARQPDPEIEQPPALLFGAGPSSVTGDVFEAGPSSVTGDVFGVDSVMSEVLPVHVELREPAVESSIPTINEQPQVPLANDYDPSPRGSPSHDSSPPSQPSTQTQYNIDDIKVEYHEASGLGEKIYAFEEFNSRASDVDPDRSDEPWKPFSSRADFEFAELAHEAHLNKGQVTRLLSLIKKIASRKDTFTFHTSDDVDSAWEKAKLRYPSFSKRSFVIDYKDEPRQFDLHSRSLWDWIVQQVKDPRLAPHFHWDAQKLSKFDGTTWIRFYDEPWTATKFADVQTRLAEENPRAKPIAIILWADTSKLSTFGGQKGHFIVARIGNLPSDIRNGSALGGGRIVGFIPIVDEDPKDKKKTTFVNFKNAVYHTSFRLFLEQIAEYSKVGCEVLCGDNVPRLLYPYIHIISADYEEHCRFVLNRGLGGYAPCPVCIVPAGSLSNIKQLWRLRTEDEIKNVVCSVDTATNKETLLKRLGARNVYNAIWDINNTNVHEAVSFDRLHAYIIGLWKQHLFGELKAIVEDMDRSVEVDFENAVKAFPRWSKLAHFSSGVLSLDYSDGNKWEHVSKIIIAVASQVLLRPGREDPTIIALLRLIRKWVELNMLLSFPVQTEKTITAFERTLNRFSDALESYKAKCDGHSAVGRKDWDGIIKVHSQTHAARDIRSKGAISNMDTKQNEKLNGAMRDAYHLQTNFRDVEAQLGRLEDRSMISGAIRGYLNNLDEFLAEEEDDDTEPHENIPASTSTKKKEIWDFNHIRLGSRQRATSISTFIDNEDPAFINFPKKIANCIYDILTREYLDSCEQRGLLSGSVAPAFPVVQDSDLITECRYIRVKFESKVTWRLVLDRLRCSPSFFGSPRYDNAIVQWQGADGSPTESVCELVRVFTYETGGRKFGLGLVQPFDRPTPSRPEDFELGLCRIGQQERRKAVVIPIRAIIRGAIVVADRRHKGEYTVPDTMDGDAYLRLMSIFPHRDMEMNVS